MDEAGDFKFGMQLGFAKAHYRIPPEEKVGVALGYGSSPKFWGSPIIFLQRLKLVTSKLARG